MYKKLGHYLFFFQIQWCVKNWSLFFFSDRTIIKKKKLQHRFSKNKNHVESRDVMEGSISRRTDHEEAQHAPRYGTPSAALIRSNANYVKPHQRRHGFRRQYLHHYCLKAARYFFSFSRHSFGGRYLHHHHLKTARYFFSFSVIYRIITMIIQHALCLLMHLFSLDLLSF